jgi:hypothetical protein
MIAQHDGKVIGWAESIVPGDVHTWHAVARVSGGYVALCRRKDFPETEVIRLRPPQIRLHSGIACGNCARILGVGDAYFST